MRLIEGGEGGYKDSIFMFVPVHLETIVERYTNAEFRTKKSQ